MPSDIRSFFGGGGVSSQEKPTPKKKEVEMKAASRGKRKVLSDSDDEEQPNTTKDPTPKKPPPKKQAKKESPRGEETTTSDYFAASGKSKPSRSTPHRPKPVRQQQESETANGTTEKRTSKDVKRSKPDPKSRASPRQKGKPTYKEEDEDEDFGHDDFDVKVLDDDEGSGEDIHEADFKPSRRHAKDEYESDDDDMIVQSKRKKGRTGATPSKGDVTKSGLPVNVSTPAKNYTPKNSKKRKSEEVEEEDESDAAPASKKARGSKAKLAVKSTASKKATPKKKSEESPVRTNVDDILDTIPTVKPPSPPPRDGSKKFDWRAAPGQADKVASGAKAEMPVGAENCLAGLSFVFTGILDSLDRNDGQELVKRHGGKVTGAPSKKTSYVVLGSEAGPKKLETIKQHGLTTIDENGLFALIRKLPANGGDSKQAEQFEAKQKKEQADIEKAAREMAVQEKEAKSLAKSTAGSSSHLNGSPRPGTETDTRLWTVKYAPSSTGMVCGNKGQVEKLQSWLRQWPANDKVGFKKPGKDGSGIFRAIILHGGPGIGKTTAAHLAAKLEGYDIVENNASDTRSKKVVENGTKGILDTTSLLGYFAGDGKKVEQGKKKLCLIMDEVDGMSGGDRGGVGAMAAICRKTHVPIILICNDKKLPKMRPFDTVAYDLPFRKPTVDQVRQRMMTICFREKLKLPPTVINALIEGSNSDIRQVINMLSTARVDQEAMDFDQGKKMSKSWEKNIILRPWDIVSKILGGGMFASSSASTLNEKIELYFNDHEFSPLMLQENYLGTKPMGASQYSGKEHNLKALELAEKAAASISDGDLVDRMIHGSQQQWSLMPTHAVFSFVRPASFVAGSMAGHQTRFTTWLGNNSKQSEYLQPSRLIKHLLIMI